VDFTNKLDTLTISQIKSDFYVWFMWDLCYSCARSIHRYPLVN